MRANPDAPASKHLDAKAPAMKLFNELVAAGKKKATAEREVKNKFNVPPRTLREWRKKT